MYNYKIWDKKEPINNVDREYWINNNPSFETDEVVLCFNADDPSQRVATIFLESELRNSYQDYKSDIDTLMKLRLNAMEGNGFDSAIELINQNKEIKKELFQAKLTLMKEGLI